MDLRDRPTGAQPHPEEFDLFLSEDELRRRHMLSGTRAPDAAAAPPPRRRPRKLPILVAVASIGAAVGAFTAGAYLYDTRSEPPSATEAAVDGLERESVSNTAGLESGPAEPAAAPSDDERSASVPESSRAPSLPAAATPRQDAARTAEPAADAESERSVTATADGGDVSGRWTVATRVESSTLERFEGLRLGYELELQQDGTRVTGSGYKVTENGTRIRRGGRTPIEVQGVSDEKGLTLSFVERGTRRASTGRFVLFHESEGRLRGRFASDAARSSGTVEARRH